MVLPVIGFVSSGSTEILESWDSVVALAFGVLGVSVMIALEQ